ncbi:glutamine synthetase family protein [Alphaproteobacteria bacterium]|nr:glutamine synthetase family protein [Alphaproteobacteria bacterium]
MTDKMTHDDMIKWLEDQSITEVECLVSDIAGIPRGKILPVHKFISAASGEELRLPEYVFGQSVTGDYLDSEVLNEIGRDVILRPDPESCRLVPWYSEPTAQIIHDAYDQNGEIVPFTARAVLKRVLTLFDGVDLEPIVAPELEFFLVEQSADANNPLATPTGKSGRAEKARQAYGIDAVNEFDPLFEEIYDHCDVQKIDIDTLSHEAGAAQMEINFNHGNALDLADQTFLFKRTLRQTALNHNVHATFMAKPMQDQPGSSMHLHLSVRDKKTGQNIFVNDDKSESDRFYHALAGMQRHMAAATALLAPYVNSYRRRTSGEDSPTNLAWGMDNRTVGLRVPFGDPVNRRIENRIPGADANPYLAIAASLAAIWLGLEEQRQPSRPRKNSGEDLATLPRNLDMALDALERASPLNEILGEPFVKLFIEVKRGEAEAFLEVISPWEREYLLLNV